jgi:hypothetical protein
MKVTIISKQCVNSKWVANWLAKSGQECCECIGCKVKIKYEDYIYIVTESEYNTLNKKE